jgi:hypothetical protein
MSDHVDVFLARLSVAGFLVESDVKQNTVDKEYQSL